MAINIHGSLLPKYRGAAPINWAIINGEAETGITLIRMNAKMDAGEIILKAAIKIDRTDTAITLREKLADLGAKNLAEVLRKIQQKEKISLLAQDERLVSLAPKLKKSDGLIDWNQSALAIHNKIRGLLPWPGSFTHYQDKIIKILASEPQEDEASGGLAGKVVKISKDGIIVETGKGLLKIKELQLESAKPLPAWQFIAGHKIEAGYRFA
jgi:methionyl-tRNA formyltransferase